MAIKEPKTVTRRGEKLKKQPGDRSYSIAKAFFVSGIFMLAVGVLSFFVRQWGSGLMFIAVGVGCYFPYRYIYTYPPTAYRLEEEGILVFEEKDKERFIKFAEIKRITVFNPEVKNNFFFNSRRNVYITLKPVSEDEDKPNIVRLFLPYEPDAVYFQLLSAKLEYDGIPVDR